MKVSRLARRDARDTLTHLVKWTDEGRNYTIMWDPQASRAVVVEDHLEWLALRQGKRPIEADLVELSIGQARELGLV